jgi:hypothetical protein
MSKKLLEESTIRSFMKLANLQPLSQKFITEMYKEEEEEEEEEPVEEEALEEAREGGDKTPSSPRPSVKGAAKPGKMPAAKNATGDAKYTAAKHTANHHVKSGNVKSSDEQDGHSNASDRKSSRGEFEVVMESLEEENDMEEKMYEEEMDAPEGADTGGGAESGPHKDKMKGLVRSMLDNLKQMGEEYGMTMEISDEGGAPEAPEGGEEMAPPEGGEGMMQEKLDEMVEKLTKRVAARLVKESKKRR